MPQQALVTSYVDETRSTERSPARFFSSMRTRHLDIFARGLLRYGLVVLLLLWGGMKFGEFEAQVGLTQFGGHRIRLSFDVHRNGSSPRSSPSVQRRGGVSPDQRG